MGLVMRNMSLGFPTRQGTNQHDSSLTQTMTVLGLYFWDQNYNFSIKLSRPDSSMLSARLNFPTIPHGIVILDPGCKEAYKKYTLSVSLLYHGLMTYAYNVSINFSQDGA